MSYTPAFLDELRSRISLSELIGRHVKLTRAGREFKACCPFHHEKSASFTISDQKKFFHCFGCGAHGDAIGFVMRHERLSFPEAIERLAALAGLQLPEDTPLQRDHYEKEKRLLDLLEIATRWFENQLLAPSGREALSYATSRRITPDALKRFRLGYAPSDARALIAMLTKEKFTIDEMLAVGLVKKSETRNEVFSFFRNRLLFPVSDRRGRTVAFGGRVLGDGEPKYLNSPDHELFHKGQLLYGLARARTASSLDQPIIVVEGYMDVIAMVEAGFSGAVAPLGTALTEDQIQLLWKLLPPVEARAPNKDYNPILCFDGDSAGARAAQRALERALPLLTPFETFRVAFMPEGKDPDEVIKEGGKERMQSILTEALPVIDVLWESLQKDRRLETPEERASFLTLIRQKVNIIRHDTLRQLYLDEIQMRFNSHFRPKTFVEGFIKKGGWRPERAALPRLRSPAEASTIREKVLLALMINYPVLFKEFGEDLAQISLETPALEDLRVRLIEILSSLSEDSLDATAVYRHLSEGTVVNAMTNQGLSVLADVLADSTYMHASFARPSQSLDGAREGWRSLWNVRIKEKLLNDLESAKRLYADSSSEENLARLMALRREVENLGKQIGLGATPEPVDHENS